MFSKNHKWLVIRFGMILVLLAGMFSKMPVKPVLASTITVINVNSSGAGSLYAAITSAISGDTIQFSPSLAGQTITLASAIAINSKHLILDGSGLSPQVTISGGRTCSILTGLPH